MVQRAKRHARSSRISGRTWLDLSLLSFYQQLLISCFQAEQAHFQELRALIRKYDKDKSGNLNAEELTKCIKVYSDARHWTTDPVTPTEEEIALLLQGAGHHKKNSVDASEIENALDLWHSYVTNRAKIQTIFEKYDTDNNQKLEFDQLVRYLTDLNEGHKPKVAALSLPFFLETLIPAYLRFLLYLTPILPSHRTPRSGRCCS